MKNWGYLRIDCDEDSRGFTPRRAPLGRWPLGRVGLVDASKMSENIGKRKNMKDDER